MVLPVIVIMTSAACGHCNQMRGDGYFVSDNSQPHIKKDGGKGWLWNEDFFRHLLRGGEESGRAKFRVFEIHFATLQGSYDNIVEISEFELADKNEIARNTFYSQNGKLMNTFALGYRKTDRPEPTEITDQTFEELLAEYIPKQISNYTYAYPSWFYCNGEIWESSIKNNTPLYGYMAGMKVSQIANGQFGVIRDSSSFTETEDPVSVAKRIATGNLNLNYTVNKSDINKNPITPGFLLLSKK